VQIAQNFEGGVAKPNEGLKEEVGELRTSTKDVKKLKKLAIL